MKKFFILAICFVLGCDSGSNTSTTSGNSGSFEHNYVKNRFKSEGYSNSDSDKAAKAVIKFHEAQKRKK